MIEGGEAMSPPLETPIVFVSAASGGVFFEIYKENLDRTTSLYYAENTLF
jgi:hypothetical protein